MDRIHCWCLSCFTQNHRIWFPWWFWNTQVSESGLCSCICGTSTNQRIFIDWHMSVARILESGGGFWQAVMDHLDKLQPSERHLWSSWVYSSWDVRQLLGTPTTLTSLHPTLANYSNDWLLHTHGYLEPPNVMPRVQCVQQSICHHKLRANQSKELGWLHSCGITCWATEQAGVCAVSITCFIYVNWPVCCRITWCTLALDRNVAYVNAWDTNFAHIYTQLNNEVHQISIYQHAGNDASGSPFHKVCSVFFVMFSHCLYV